MPPAPFAPATPLSEAPCPNCAGVLPASARFCCECGQRQQARVPTLRTWFAEWIEEGFGLDARVPRTLRALLFSPGFLTREWFAGRRVRYISAFRLYLLCSLVMFGTAIGLRFVGDHWNIGYRPRGALADDAYAQLARESATHALFLLVPVSAVWLSWLFRRSGQVFIEHLVFSLHVHAFGFIAAAGSFLMVFAPGGAVLLLQALFALAVFAHLVLALRHVYQVTLGWALAKGAFVLVVQGVAVMTLTLLLTEFRSGSAAHSRPIEGAPHQARSSSAFEVSEGARANLPDTASDHRLRAGFTAPTAGAADGIVPAPDRQMRG